MADFSNLPPPKASQWAYLVQRGREQLPLWKYPFASRGKPLTKAKKFAFYPRSVYGINP